MFRRRRFRRRFTTRRGKRREPIWVNTAYNVAKAPLVLQRDIFELVSPVEYNPTFIIAGTSRTDHATVVRTVGHFLITPFMSDLTSTQRNNRVTAKAALFIASTKEVDDSFAADPAQFDLIDPPTFEAWCFNYSPLQVFWNMWAELQRDAGTDFGNYWYPPGETLQREWDVKVPRKMVGDESLWLLINSVSQQVGQELEFGHGIDVESRTVIFD